MHRLFPDFDDEIEKRGKLLGKNTPVSFPPASRQDPDPRVPDKGTLQVPAKRDPEFGPWNRAPFQKIENF